MTSKPTESNALFNLNDPAVIADPYPHYAWLRDEAPVYHSLEPDMWILSRHDDVAMAVRDATRFSSNLSASGSGNDNPFNPAATMPSWLAGLMNWLMDRMRLRLILTSDPPEHTRLRQKVSSAFTPRRIAAWEPRIREITDHLVDNMGRQALAGKPVDLVRDLASPLPIRVIAEMMGVPERRHQHFKRWSDNLVRGVVTGAGQARMVKSALEMSGFFARTARQRRRSPASDDLVGLLVRSDQNGQALSLADLIAFCGLLMVAGNETTTNLICNAMLALFDRPDLWRNIRDQPSLAAAAVEEALRFDAPGQGLLRIAASDITIGDTTIPAGARVLSLIASANRDPRQWADPDEFRLDRETNEHIGFGHGIHFCLGRALARLETRVALETLARRLPYIAPAGQPARIQSPVLRGLRSLPVVVRPATVRVPGQTTTNK